MGIEGRFEINLSEQSENWPKGSLKSETLTALSLQIGRQDHMVSFDVRSGYRHLRLAPRMRDMFLFRYGGRFYKCVALPFGWGRSPLWFTSLMRPLVAHMRGQFVFRVLSYIDDFLVMPGPEGTTASLDDCRNATRPIDASLDRLGLTRHPRKGEWVGSTRVEHLGVVVDTATMRFYSAPRKLLRLRKLSAALLRQSRFGRRWVDRRKLRSFAGIGVSLLLAMPFARFHCRSLHDDLSRPHRHPAVRDGLRVRLSHAALKDLHA